MPTRRPLLLGLLLAAIALAVGATAYATMRSGIGLTNDSRAYERLSQGLLDRAHGVPLADDDILTRRFPPMFPAILAAGEGALRIGLSRVARLMNVACAIVSTLLVAAIVWNARRAAWRAVLAAALFAVASDTLHTHIHLWSEPTFLVWVLLGTLALGRYLRAGARRWLFVAASLAAGAILTRYAGAAFVLAGCIAIVVRSPQQRPVQRLIDAFLFGLVPTIALLAWALAVPQHNAGVGQRDVTIAWIGWPRLDNGLQVIGGWLVWIGPTPVITRTLGVATIAVLIALIVRWRRAFASPTLALPWAYCCVYPPFLLASITFADPTTPIDLRILEPLHAMAIVLGCATLGTSTRRTAIAAGVLLIAQLVAMTHFLGTARQTGMGYASARWRDQQTVRAAATLPTDAAIFTTHRTALEIINDRYAFDWPYWTGSVPPRTFDLAVLPLLEATHAGGGVYLVSLKRPAAPSSKRFLSPDELGHYVTLQRVADLPDGRVFKVDRVLVDVRPSTSAPTRGETDEPDAN